jgi:hypothetical protein
MKTENEIPPTFAAVIRQNAPFYTHPKVLNDGRWACVMKLMFHAALIVASPRAWLFGTYEDRWCYRDEAAAAKALDDWDGAGEPQGWHKHPPTGRRRDENGDPLDQYM